MNELLELLIDSMDTVNGFRDTAQDIKKQVYDQKYKRESKRQVKIQTRQDMKKISFLDKNKISN